MTHISDLKIKPDNIKPHADIEEELMKHINDWYHFEIRCSGGNIVDFVMREFISYEKPKSQ